MFAIIVSLFLLAAESHGAAPASGFTKFYNDYLNIPGFEVWKFINLAIFVAIMVKILRIPLSDAFKAKREQIRAELIKAEQEKQDALTKLTAAEGKLAQLETEKASILEKAKNEADFEKKRLADQTKADIVRLRQQADAELARIAGQSRASLRRFSAEESIRLAEARLRASIDDSSDSRLIKAGISEIGGLN